MTNWSFLKIKKRTLLLSICLTGCCAMFHAPNAAAKQNTNDTTDVMISYKNNIGKAFILKNVTKVEKDLNKVEIVRATVNNQQYAILKKNKNIEFIDHSSQKMSITDVPTKNTVNVMPVFKSYWNLNYVKAPSFWKKGYLGSGVKVAVIDTGINNVPDLKNVVKRVSFVKDNPRTKAIDESDPWDRGNDGEGHGTSVAAVIGAQIGSKAFNHSISDIIGVAPNVQLYSLKYADGTKDGSIGEVIEAINWSIKYKMDIINISSSVYEDNPSLKKAIDKAVKAGIIIVASAGNEGNSNKPTYPARYNNVVGVSSIGKDKKCSVFSNTGTSIDFAAPGDYIPTINSSGALFYATGTSFAAPHVTGLLALLKEKYPYSSVSEILQKLKDNALDLGAKGKDSKYGYGLAQMPKLFNTKPKELNDVQISKVKDHQATITYNIPEDSNIKKVILIINSSKIISTTKSSYTLNNLNANKTYKVLLKVVDKNGDSSDGIEQSFRTKEDTTPPSEIEKLSTSNLKINSGNLSWVNPTDKDFKLTEIYLNDEFVDATEFESYTIKKLKPDSDYQVTLVTTDQSGNGSNGVTIKIHTPSAKTITKPSVGSVNTSSQSISGKSEPNTLIVVKKGTKNLAKGTANLEGQFELKLPFQAVDTILSVTASDSIGNISLPAVVKIKQSKTVAPPIVHVVTTNTKYLRGKAEIDSNVYAYRGNTLLAAGHVDTNGYFILNIKNQPQDTVLTVLVKNRLGVKSKPYKITVK